MAELKSNSVRVNFEHRCYVGFQVLEHAVGLLKIFAGGVNGADLVAIEAVNAEHCFVVRNYARFCECLLFVWVHDGGLCGPK